MTAAGLRSSSTAEAAGKFRIFDFAFEPTRVYTFWSGLLGGVALTLATHGTDQFLVQRLLSAKSAKSAASGLVLSGVIVFVQFALFLMIGAALYVFYQQTPLPRALVSNDEVLPLFVVTSLSHGAAGFIVAAIIAAALSPSINALAATTVNDFYLKYVRPDADQATLMRVSKAATIFWGVAQIGVALGAQWIRSVLDTGLAVLSLAAGPVLGAFLIGVLTSGVGSRAMIVGMSSGVVVLAWVWWTAATAWTWYAFIGSSVTFASALAASFRRTSPRLQPCRAPLTVMTERFKAAASLLRQAIGAGAFPGAAVEVGRGDGFLWRACYGPPDLRADSAAVDRSTIYDLASLTKVLATTTLVMRAVDDGRLDLEEPIAGRLPDWKGSDREEVTIRDLLEHASGLTAYLPFYRDYTGRQEFEHAICTLPLEYAPRSQSIYSDLGFMLLAFILEDAQPPGPAFRGSPGTVDPSRGAGDAIPPARLVFHGRTDALQPAAGMACARRADRSRRMARTPPRRRSPRREYLGAWRRRRARRPLRHGRRGRCLRSRFAADYRRRTDRRRSAARCGRSSRETNVPDSSRALGWDTMLPTSSCGTAIARRRSATPGFTGTSLWIDWERDFYVVFLTNRVHPTRDNEAIRRIRPLLHDAIVAELASESAWALRLRPRLERPVRNDKAQRPRRALGSVLRFSLESGLYFFAATGFRRPDCRLMTVVPSPAGPDAWTTLTVITLVPVPVNVDVARAPEVGDRCGLPPSNVHS